MSQRNQPPKGIPGDTSENDTSAAPEVSQPGNETKPESTCQTQLDKQISPFSPILLETGELICMQSR